MYIQIQIQIELISMDNNSSQQLKLYIKNYTNLIKNIKTIRQQLAKKDILLPEALELLSEIKTSE